MAPLISRIAIATIAILVFAAWATMNLIQTQVARNDAMASRVFDMSREYRSHLGQASAQFSNNWNTIASYTWAKALDNSSGWFNAENGTAPHCALSFPLTYGYYSLFNKWFRLNVHRLHVVASLLWGGAAW